MHRLKYIAAVAALIAMVAGCDQATQDSATTKESRSRDRGYAALVANDPAHQMSYSPTRKTINFWIDTWNKPGQLAYTYLQNANGDIIGYYVLQGPPVSMCAALTPTQKINYDGGSDGGGNVITNAPSVDGVYYSGGQCNEYYGKDATSGAYIEYSVGLGINVLLYTQPLPPQRVDGAPNLSPTAKK